MDRALQLDSYSGKGKVTPSNLRRRTAKVREEAGFTGWPSNAMRHSFASYLLALCKDAPRVAHEMGHQSSGMLFQNYRKLVTAEEGKKYFQILP
jgi:integrase